MRLKHSSYLFILFLLIVGSLGSTVRGQNSRLVAAAERMSNDRFTVTARTPRGAAIYAVSRPSGALLSAIDRGLSDLFTVARRNGYGNRLNYSDYTVFVGKADRTRDSAGQYSPDIAIGSGQYKGSVFDQGGFIYAAGVVISNDPCAFLIAEPTRDFERVSNVVRYEGEHLVLYHNDRRRYQATADHSRGGTHPILQ